MTDREKLKQELLEELKQEYYLKPKSDRLQVNDILEKYENDLIQIGGRTFAHNGWSQKESIKQAIRKIVCLKMGVQQMKDVPKNKYTDFRLEVERIITNYLGLEKK